MRYLGRSTNPGVILIPQAINSEYQRWTFNLNYLDSLSKVRKKEEAEEQLQHLERLITQLSAKHVFLKQ